MTCVRFERRADTARAFFVLAHLDLGRDSASLYDDTLPERPWVARLHRAHIEAPGRLALHGLPLRREWSQVVATLRTGPPPELRDDAGRRLATCFADAWDACADFVPQWADPPALLEPLSILREALWERRGGPPPLCILDVEALGPHARAIEDDATRVVATSLAEDPEHTLCQIFHEEVHPVSDQLVEESIASRDTRVGTPGYAAHQALERTAIEVGQAIIEARLPALIPAYERWRRRFEPTG